MLRPSIFPEEVVVFYSTATVMKTDRAKQKHILNTKVLQKEEQYRKKSILVSNSYTAFGLIVQEEFAQPSAHLMILLASVMSEDKDLFAKDNKNGDWTEATA